MPPLILLQTLEAVTRLGSLKRAAEEMHLTPSAISHRIRLLEEQFGQRLFERDGQGIRPADNARQLSATIAQAIATIDDHWRELTDRPETRRVRLCSMAAFAEQFILSNLDEFRRRFPDFQVDSTSLTISEGGMRGDFDILIGIGPYPGEGWEYEDLMPFTLKAVYSAQSETPIVSGDIVLGPILNASTNSMPWENALRSLGYTMAPTARQVRFDSVLTACHAAARGKGIALAPTWFADKLVAQGEVLPLGDGVIRSDLSYWIAVRKSRKLQSTYGRFRRWLNSAIERTG
ncbi:LysR family transcriptional regulator [uncultured Sphingomonas sp.]|uniref:LysR family transcriptional regulator n=1 Tax=uncultured Sphingomonas sp. TaxID=158754 RepID=UPI00261DF3CF|nr:LysR family transcriptional regulator [uncultured Sphingomonas sp.]